MDSGTASDSMISDESVLALYGNNKTTATTHYSGDYCRWVRVPLRTSNEEPL